jgi:hypothetical protein
LEQYRGVAAQKGEGEGVGDVEVVVSGWKGELSDGTGTRRVKELAATVRVVKPDGGGGGLRQRLQGGAINPCGFQGIP